MIVHAKERILQRIQYDVQWRVHAWVWRGETAERHKGCLALLCDLEIR
jgi:hypothetical protein